MFKFLALPMLGGHGAPSHCSVTYDHFSPIKLKLKDAQS